MNNLRTDGHNNNGLNADNIFMHVASLDGHSSFMQVSNPMATKKSPTATITEMNSQRASGLQKRAFCDDLTKQMA